MSDLVSKSHETRTAILESPTAQASTESIELDAAEDREIVGYQLFAHGWDLGLDSWGTARAYTGRNPEPPVGDLRDNEQFFAKATWESNSDSANNRMGEQIHGSGEYIDISDRPIPWDKHVTLTVECQEEGGNDTAHAELILHYREV